MPNHSAEVEQLRARLQDAEDTIEAIRAGQVDALVVSGPTGEQVFTVAGSENAYRVFVEAMSEGAATVGTDGTLLYCNRAFADLLKRPLERILGASIYPLVAEDDRDAFEAAFRDAQQDAAKAEISLVCDGGTTVPVMLSLRSFKEFGSRAISMIATDLTQQKREQEMMAAGKLARTIMEQAVEAIAVCDHSGRIILASRALYELCDCNPLFRQFDEMASLQLHYVDLTGEHERPFSIGEVLAGRRFRGAEVVLAKDSGECCQLLLSAGPVRLPSEATSGCVVTLFDIAERKRAEDALRNAERLAATGRLAATIAHEINNPLESVTNLLYLIRARDHLDPLLAQYADMAQSELGRVAHITKQTLAFHRESHQATPVNLRSLIESVVYLHGQRLQSKNIRFVQELEFNGEIRGFANELRQVISNIFANAIEACRANGTLRLRVYASAERNNASRAGVRIIIGDNGPGIPKNECHRIFEPFYTTKGERGTGLGLWVSQGIVIKHGGFIRLRSCTQTGRSGTVFCVFLPVNGQSLGASETAVA